MRASSVEAVSFRALACVVGSDVAAAAPPAADRSSNGARDYGHERQYNVLAPPSYSISPSSQEPVVLRKNLCRDRLQLVVMIQTAETRAADDTMRGRYVMSSQGRSAL